MNGLLALALAAGMLAPVNPCGVALLPAWFTYTIGDADTAPVPVRLARSLRAGAALTLGFAGTLAAVGIAVSAGAHAVIGATPWLGLAIGVALVLVGAVMLSGRSLGLRLPTTSRTPRAGAPGTGRMVAFGAGYAAASLSCGFGVLLAVIAQAQATATFAGLLAVFAAYALGSATVLLLVAISTAAAGAVLIRRIAPVARYGNRHRGGAAGDRRLPDVVLVPGRDRRRDPQQQADRRLHRSRQLAPGPHRRRGLAQPYGGADRDCGWSPPPISLSREELRDWHRHNHEAQFRRLDWRLLHPRHGPREARGPDRCGGYR